MEIAHIRTTRIWLKLKSKLTYRQEAAAIATVLDYDGSPLLTTLAWQGSEYGATWIIDTKMVKRKNIAALMFEIESAIQRAETAQEEALKKGGETACSK